MNHYTATAPSNIALIKYWGKQDATHQWPANDSLSMTLSLAVTRTTARAWDGPDHQVHFANDMLDRGDNVGKRIYQHLDRLSDFGKFDRKLHIATANTFPKGCGIASSASGFAALTIAAMAAWTEAASMLSLEDHGFTRSALAQLARMGSGSAARSLHGGFVSWKKGETHDSQMIVQDFTPQHWSLSDLIVLCSAEEKKVTSSAGHASAWSSPQFKTRLAGLKERLHWVKSAIQERDMDLLGRAIEDEALEMHSVMMTSKPSLHYLNDQTFQVLEWVRQYRQEHKTPVYFTLDAGPTVHLICESKHAKSIRQQLSIDLPDRPVICDHVGAGANLEVRDLNCHQLGESVVDDELRYS